MTITNHQTSLILIVLSKSSVVGAGDRLSVTRDKFSNVKGKRHEPDKPLAPDELDKLESSLSVCDELVSAVGIVKIGFVGKCAIKGRGRADAKAKEEMEFPSHSSSLFVMLHQRKWNSPS